MATEILEVSGVASWAKLREDQLDKMFKPNWQIQITLDEKSVLAYKNSGLRLEPLAVKKLKNGKDVEPGDEKTFTFKRYAPDDDRGVMKDSRGRPNTLPPQVFLDNEPYVGVIGNGSLVSAKIDVYDTKKYGKGHRLVAVRVDKLEQYLAPDENADFVEQFTTF